MDVGWWKGRLQERIGDKLGHTESTWMINRKRSDIMPWHLPERDTHEVPTPGGHQEDGEAGGDDAGDGPTDGDRAHEGGGEPGHDSLESAL